MNASLPGSREKGRETERATETLFENARLAQSCRQLEQGGRVTLVLDYDGTLVPIARTPEEAKPSPELLALLGELAQEPALDVIVLSGRHIESLASMLTVPGILLAGTYGVEIRPTNEDVFTRIALETVRPRIERIKGEWTEIIGTREGIWLEDKGFGVAMHARFASEADAGRVLPAAEQAAIRATEGAPMRILGGDRFLEVAPALANKGLAVEWLLENKTQEDALVVYFGDDDKDEEAFAVVLEHGGIPIIVGERIPDSKALVRLANPTAVYTWLCAMREAAKNGRGAIIDAEQN